MPGFIANRHAAGLKGAAEFTFFDLNKKTGKLGFGLGNTLLTLGMGYLSYKEEGLWGAAKSLTQQAAMGYVGSALLGSLAGPAMLATMGGAALYYGGKAAIDAGKNYKARRRLLDFGNPLVDQYSTMATMRQRSMAAMMNSHTNMRSALGNEAMFVHR